MRRFEVRGWWALATWLLLAASASASAGELVERRRLLPEQELLTGLLGSGAEYRQRLEREGTPLALALRGYLDLEERPAEAAGRLEEAGRAALERLAALPPPKGVGRWERLVAEVGSRGEALWRWAQGGEVGPRARALRQLAAVLRAGEAYRRLEVAQRKGGGDLVSAGEVWGGQTPWRGHEELDIDLRLHLPCELLRDRPDDVMSAFAELEEAPLRQLLGGVLDCPFPAFHGGEPALADYIAAWRLLTGETTEAERRRMLAAVPAPPPEAHPQVGSEREREPPAGEWDGKQARRWMHRDREKAERTLRASTLPRDRLSLALLLHAYGDGSEATREEIRGLLAEVAAVLPERFRALPLPKGGYDGSDQSLLPYVTDYTDKTEQYYLLPCALLQARPGLVPALSAYHGGNRDNFLPRDDCDLAEYPLPPSVEEYLQRVAGPTRGWLEGYEGTLRFAHHRNRNKAELELHLFPRLLAERKVRTEVLNDENQRGSVEVTWPPYESWSYLNLVHRAEYEALLPRYEAALRDLTAHYRDRFGLPEEEAARAAFVGLRSAAVEGHWGPPPRSGLRYRIMSGAPLEAIRTELDGAEDLARLTPTYLRMGYYDGAWSYVGDPDPLIMVTVHRPEVLALLLDRHNSGDYPPIEKPWPELLRGDAVIDVNAVNGIHKTPLMAAAQADSLPSVELLLAHGAAVEARTDSTTHYGQELRHDFRTPLMYAAANASPELVERLLRAGARRDAEDNLGLRPIHYLLGFDGLPRNPRLRTENLGRYLELLFPAAPSPHPPMKEIQE